MASQSPPRRLARASKPSRKAQATSSVTKPTTKKSKKRATAQGSKAAPKRRKVVVPAAAEDNEVVGDEESEPSGVQQQSSPPQGFEYTALWRVDGPKKERLADTVRQFSDILTVTPISEFKAWYQDQLVAELRDYQFKKVVLASGHGGRVESRWLCAGANTIDFSMLVKDLTRYHEKGNDNLQMSFTAHVVPTAASQSTQQSQARGHGGRNTATSRMLAQAAGDRSQMESDGNLAAQITEQWTCKQADCLNYGFNCWWSVRDTKEYHLPVKGVHLLAWSASIDRGEATAEIPMPSLMY
jgi:hypothetical protein